MTGHVFYRPVRVPRRRPSRCTTREGLPKKGWATRKDAVSVLAMMRSERRDVATLEPYHCPVCDGWHLGNAYRFKEPYTRRVVDRDPALLVEVGERAAVQMLAESAPGRHRPRVHLIADRFKEGPHDG